MLSDKLLINLKIISKIQKNGRIARSYDGMISLESDTYYQPIKRFLSSDSRKQAVYEINSIITECIDAFFNIINSKYMNKLYSQSYEYFKGCENISLLLSELHSAKNGLENLKFTYQDDPNVSSQLDIVILKINTTLRDITQKLNHLQLYLPQTRVMPHNNNQTPYENDPTPHEQQTNDPTPHEQTNDLTSIYVDSTNDIIQLSPI